MAGRIIRLPEVVRQTGLSPATIYRAIRAGTFPPQVMLGKRATGWRTTDVDAWIDSREEKPVSDASARHRKRKGGAHGSPNTAAQ